MTKIEAQLDPSSPRRARKQLKGRQVDLQDLHELRETLGAQQYQRDHLIEYLHRINDQHRGLPERLLVALADEMRLGMAEVFEVASFYHHFDILPDGQTAPTLTVRVCDSLSCELLGARQLREALPAHIADMNIKVVGAPCLGRCEQAPCAAVGQQVVLKATLQSLSQAVAVRDAGAHIGADDAVFDPASLGPHAVTTGTELIAPAFVGYAQYRAQGGYLKVQSLAVLLDRGELAAEDIFKQLESSGLRGLGGAGFPAGRKWRIVAAQEAPRLMAVNIDEGEPGTFKDRTYLERDPHRFLEGLLIATKVVGVSACYIYLRDEYHACRQLLQAELARLQADPPFSLPTIELRRGAGAYICGEESAMIESIEGKRGEPRLRPPYIAQVGLFGRPTLEHNFETLYWLRDIFERGAPWFAAFGRHGRQGLRSFSVSGRVKEPGVKLAPAGITLRELVSEFCGGMQDGHELYAYLPGGASGGILPARLADLPLDFDTLQPHGCFIGSAAVIVLSQADKARQAASNVMRFFADESCGQCTPCRVGTVKAVHLMQAPRWDQPTLSDLCSVMADASICGLGQAAPNPIRCVQQYFADEVDGSQA